MKYLLVLPAVLLPSIAFGATPTLQTLLSGIGNFINSAVIPLTLGFAFLVFAINVVRFFVIGGNNEEGQENAKSLAVYGLAAFVLILSFWGLVNVLSGGIGLDQGNCVDGKNIQSDYISLDHNPPCSSPRPVPRPTNNTNTTPNNAPYQAPITNPIST